MTPGNAPSPPAPSQQGFRYHTVRRPALAEQIAVGLHEAGMVAVAGPYGVGKTTLIQGELRELVSGLSRTAFPLTSSWASGQVRARMEEFALRIAPGLPRPILLLPDVGLHPDDLPESVREAGIQLVIESRRPELWQRVCPVVPIPPFTRDESIEYVVGCSTGLTVLHADLLAARLEDQPLALAHAVPGIRPGRSLSAFFTVAQSCADVVFGATSPNGYQTTLTDNVRHEFDELAATGRAAPRSVAAALALMNGGPYPFSDPVAPPFRPAATQLAVELRVRHYQLSMAFRALQERGLARITNGMVSLSWVRAQIIRSLLAPEERKQAAQLAEAMLLNLAPAGNGLAEWKDYRHWAVGAGPMMAISPHDIITAPGRTALLAAVDFTHGQGHTEEALRRLAVLRSEWQRPIGNRPALPWELRALSLDLSARMALRLGDARAKRHSTAAFRIRHSKVGFGDRDTIASGVTMARAAGDYVQLSELKEHADELGDHRAVLRIRSAMAEIQLNSTFALPPVTELNEVVQGQAVILDALHPETLDSRLLLAHAYAKSGQADLAGEQFELTLAGRITSLGSDHPDSEAARKALHRHRREASQP